MVNPSFFNLHGKATVPPEKARLFHIQRGPRKATHLVDIYGKTEEEQFLFCTHNKRICRFFLCSFPFANLFEFVPSKYSPWTQSVATFLLLACCRWTMDVKRRNKLLWRNLSFLGLQIIGSVWRPLLGAEGAAATNWYLLALSPDLLMFLLLWHKKRELQQQGVAGHLVLSQIHTSARMAYNSFPPTSWKQLSYVVIFPGSLCFRIPTSFLLGMSVPPNLRCPVIRNPLTGT